MVHLLWNDCYRDSPNSRSKTCPSTVLSTRYPTQTDLGLKLPPTPRSTTVIVCLSASSYCIHTVGLFCNSAQVECRLPSSHKYIGNICELSRQSLSRMCPTLPSGWLSYIRQALRWSHCTVQTLKSIELSHTITKPVEISTGDFENQISKMYNLH
jgi:hypothetical protein